MKYRHLCGCNQKGGRSPCGERGLKYRHLCGCNQKGGRSPCGERGLKYIIQHAIEGSEKVAPRAGSVD